MYISSIKNEYKKEEENKKKYKMIINSEFSNI